MNKQAEFLAQKLKIPGKSINGVFAVLDKNQISYIPYDPQHNPAHSRMVLDAMVERGYQVETHQDKLSDGRIFNQCRFIGKGGERGFGEATSYESLDKAICDAAEAALRSEEG